MSMLRLHTMLTCVVILSLASPSVLALLEERRRLKTVMLGLISPWDGRNFALTAPFLLK